jgi:hypothetical protein
MLQRIFFTSRLMSLRFAQKFAQIVQRERGENFITKLHKGQLKVIPWAVIGSAQFYSLFGVLKDQLGEQQTTFKHASVFIDILKTLMAKLKVR